MNNYIFLLLGVATLSNAQPGCRQVGNRLMALGDSKELRYVSCSCPCNEYEQLARGQQCAECKHYPEPGQHTLYFLNNIDIHKAHQQSLEDAQEE